MGITDMCLSKTSYESKEEALDSIRYLEENNIATCRLTTYKCPLCQQYHLSSK